MTKTTPIADRFWAKVDQATTPNGCWTWTAHLHENGYPRFNDGRSGWAHRAAWEIAHGEQVPEGMTIDHLCRNRACVRPDHLEAVTQRTNNLRSTNPPARNAVKTECVHGHTLADAYLVHRTRNGGYVERKCRSCQNAHDRGRARR